MKIPRQLSQFAGEHVLVVVAGKQQALLYSAHDGYINLIDSLFIPRPHYSDHEGEFKTRSQNGTMRSGSANELRDQDIISEFMRELKKHFKHIESEKYSGVYVLAPSKTKNTIVQHMPKTLENRLRGVVLGNYHHASPLDVIRKIADARHV